MNTALNAFSCIAAALFLCGASSCSSIQTDDLFRKVDADVWLHRQLPKEICEASPVLYNYGIVRDVKCNDEARSTGLCGPDDKVYDEFIPYCDPAITRQISMHKNQFKKWIDLAKEKINNCR